MIQNVNLFGSKEVLEKEEWIIDWELPNVSEQRIWGYLKL